MSIYKTDKKYWFAAAFIIVIGLLVIWASPEYWKIVVGCWIGYVALAYFMRNNQ